MKKTSDRVYGTHDDGHALTCQVAEFPLELAANTSVLLKLE